MPVMTTDLRYVRKGAFYEDGKEALRFLQKHFKDKARAVLEGEGHCKPSFEVLSLL